MRYFLIDRVVAFAPGERVRGIKNVTLSDEVLHDHFPEYPLMPGALIIESAAQLAGFLLEVGQEPDENGAVRRALLIQIDKAKLRDRARPGDQLEVTVALTSMLHAAAQVHAEVIVGERRIAQADLTFSLMTVAEEAIHEQRRRLYRLWTRDLDLPVPIL
jgi:3-hydroxyacyl-[acyl-carrier-protein] dehydratase